MPALLPNTTTTDNYRDCTLGGDRGYAYGTLTVANNPVSILLKHGARGNFSETEYTFVTPSTLPLVGIIGRDEIVGAQIKSAIPGGGSPAQVSGWLVEPNVAGLQPGSAYTQQVSPGGSVTPTPQVIGVTGRVSGAGAVVAGTGFTAARIGVGNYRITFTTPFAGPPAVFATIIPLAMNGFVELSTAGYSASQFECFTINVATHTVADEMFIFLATEMI